jgi:hypothetical protein
LCTSTLRLIPPLNGPPNRILEAFPFDTAPKYLLRDRDGIYGQEFHKQVEVMNINEVLSAPGSPWLPGYSQAEGIPPATHLVISPA